MSDPTELRAAVEAHLAAGKFGEAAEAYRQILVLEPRNAVVLAGLGALAGQEGRHDLAAHYLEQACTIEPDNPVYLYNFGESLRQLGQFTRAETILRRAIELDRYLCPAYDLLLAVLELAHAQALCRQDSRQVEALCRELAFIANNQGNAWLDLGNPSQAMSCYRRALVWSPDYVSAHSNLGNVLRELGLPSEAETACRRALELDPQFSAAWNNLGNALVDQGEPEAGQACYGQALALCPVSEEALHNRASGCLMATLYRDDLSAEEVTQRHLSWGAQYAAFQQPPCIDRSGNIRVGFISADFREHSVAYFIEGLLGQLDRSQFELFCYSSHPGEDQVTARIKALPLTWRQVDSLSDDQLCDLLRQDHLHLLIDLNGHTRGTRLSALARKPVPVQAHFIGYPACCGLPAFDFRITDRFTDPEPVDGTQQTEKPAYLPHSQFNYRPRIDAPEVNRLPALETGRITFGSLNNIQKINRSVVSAWSALLQRVPDSRLLLHHKLLADPGCRSRIKGLFEAFGISSQRLAFFPAAEQHLLRYHEIDIALDTFPYNGATTTCEALWMGVPVLSLAGDRPAGRMGASILAAVGMESWLAPTVPAYIDTAHAWSTRLEQLAELRQGLRQKVLQSQLCDTRRFAEEFGLCIRQMLDAAEKPAGYVF